MPVDRLLADAEREGIDLMTLRRAAERLSVTKLVCWALPGERATVESEKPAEAEEQAVAAVADSDPGVERAVAEVSKLIMQGLSRGIAIHRACRGDRELARQVEAVLGKH